MVDEVKFFEKSCSETRENLRNGELGEAVSKRWIEGHRLRQPEKWSSYKGRRANALASEAEEGRGKLRKAAGSGKHTSIRRCPNGAIRLSSYSVTAW